jgi:4-methyl-5(b-hydroxyethyl)-thiazole monophosphate biosynthesis
VEADTLLDEVAGRTFDCLVVPGGPGTKALRQDPRVLELVRAHRGEDKLIGAICAAPTVLLDAGVLPGIRYTGHASILAELPELQEQAVVVDGKVLTSRGAGTAVEFGLALVAALLGQEQADAVAASIHFGEER